MHLTFSILRNGLFPVFRCTICAWLGFFFVSVLPACTSDAETTITFCETTGSPQPCSGDQTEFSTGQRLSVYLEAAHPLEARQVVGNILRLLENDTIPLGTRPFVVEPDQRLIVQDLPFHEFGPQAAGRFLIEFVDENDQVMARKELTIN